jgi:CubicO group peptidase (beta-lactamase class C family)
MAYSGIDDQDLKATIAQFLDRWPCAGLAVAVIKGSGFAWFHGHGLADVAAETPITEDTVFRIGSITKTFTAIAVMQLWEQGLVDLDAPANDYLRTFQLVPGKQTLRPATVRHLLTHTAGVGYWRRLSDLLQPGVGSGVRARRSGAPPLANYYRRGLPVEVEPGTKWAYSNHGFAALGQIVEDVSGQPLDRYLRDRIFDPLSMQHTDLVRSERVQPHLATGYVLRSRGLKPVIDREVPTPGGGAMYSTTRDIARYIAALLGAEDCGFVLKPETVAAMFQPHFQPDPRLPGMGLGFELGEERGYRTVGKTGIVSGFHSAVGMAPDEGIGVIVLSNTGGLDGRGAAEPLAAALLRRLLGLPADPIRIDVPPRPETWSEICGWYGLEPGPVTNLFTRTLMGAGAEIVVQGGHLMLKPLTPIPALRRGFRLYPDDPDDPALFRVYFPEFGMDLRVVFARGRGQKIAMRLFVNLMSFERRPDLGNPRRWATGALTAGTAAVAIRSVLRHHRSGRLMGSDQAPERSSWTRLVDSTSARRSSRALAAKTSMSG